ncbi:MAG: nucleoside deaminase [Clostridia bacterium]
MNKYLSLAKEVATKSYINNEGGPFGAVITDKDGNVIAKSSNKVLIKKDPTAHAEIEAIRQACLKLDKFDLSGYILYTSCEPCPMCLSAIIWANIKTVYYGCTKKDAANIGFRDDLIYDYFLNKDKNILDMQNINREECLEMFKEYKDLNKTIY